MARRSARRAKAAPVRAAEPSPGQVFAAIAISMGIFGINVVRWFGEAHADPLGMRPYVLGFQLAVVASALSVLVRGSGGRLSVVLAGSVSLGLLAVVMLNA